MIGILRRLLLPRHKWAIPAVAGVLLLTVGLGWHPSLIVLGALVAGLGVLLLLQRPSLTFFVLVVGALLVPISIPTGTEVKLNLAALLPPVMLAMGWFNTSFGRMESLIVPSVTNKPLAFFLLAGLLSLLIGTVLWDPVVPRSGNFVIVQLAQWAIFAFSAIAFWMVGAMVREQALLQRLTWFYLGVAGSVALVRVLPGLGSLRAVATYAVDRAPFWLLLTALTGGQLLFNRNLSALQRWFLIVVAAAILYYSFVLERKTLSNLAGVAPVIGMLVWMRWPRLRRVFVTLAVLTALFLFPVLYNFAGGDAEWEESGGSRLALAGRVIEVSMRNPVTGIGPAAYRAYARMKPLLYEQAYYLEPAVNSHNNYVDLFSQLGLVGVALFFWFSAQVLRLGFRLCACFTQGFVAGYANAMLAAWVGALVVMLFADWILPFVYNIGFPGFQASVLVWLFVGGLVSLEQWVPNNLRHVPARKSVANVANISHD